MHIRITKTEFGKPQVTWIQQELDTTLDKAGKYTIWLGAGSAIVTGALVGAASGSGFLSLVFALFSGCLGVGIGHFFGAAVHRETIVGTGLTTKSFEGKLMLGNSPESNFMPTLLSAPSSDKMRGISPGIYYSAPANEVTGFTVDSAQNWLNFPKELPPVHVLLLTHQNSEAMIVAMHYGSLNDINSLRVILHQTFIEARPRKGWPDPSQPPASELASFADDDPI